MGQTIQIKTADGHAFDAYVAQPQGKPRAALVVLQEIFGVNSHIKSLADGFAADGYLAIAPALFDRVQREFDTGYLPPEIHCGLTIMQQLDLSQTMLDVAAAVAACQGAGKVGAVGYSWGGTVAWLSAAHVSGLACAVAYYPGGILNFADEAPRVPVLCHFGEEDISPLIDQARALAARYREITALYYPVGHGFNCDQRASYNADCARLAREDTLRFLAEHVG